MLAPPTCGNQTDASVAALCVQVKDLDPAARHRWRQLYTPLAALVEQCLWRHRRDISESVDVHDTEWPYITTMPHLPHHLEAV